MRLNNLPLLVIVTSTFILGPCSFLLFGDEMTNIGKKETITLTFRTRVGDTFLEPGKYQVQHIGEGGKTFMVFRKVRPWHDRPVEVARQECRFQPLSEKVDKSQIVHQQGKIKEILINGENVKHVLVGR